MSTAPVPVDPDATGTGAARLSRLVRGRAADPAWVRPALLALLAATAVLYLWGLGNSGWENAYFYSWARSAATGWKAFFFGSTDPNNLMAADTPPAAAWVMGLSQRLFGTGPWAVLVPQALEGVASTGLLYLTVRRQHSALAGLIAAAVFAVTPVATLMFRYDRPDALLTLAVIAAAYCLVRALEHDGVRWLVACSALLGLAFLTKMLQGLIVVPVFALVYLLAARASGWRRFGRLALGGLVLAVSGGWWVAIVELWPADSRPYIAETQHNSYLELVLGANGLDRMTGGDIGSAVGGNRSLGGWGRLFGPDVGGQVSWFLPAAAIFLVLLFVRRRRPALMLWGGWAALTGFVFTTMQGRFFACFTVELAPAIAALVGLGVAECRRESRGRRGLAVALAVTAVWQWVLMERNLGPFPWIGRAAALAGVSAVVLLATRTRPVVVVALAVVACFAGPVAYSLDTVASPHNGDGPSAGPAARGMVAVPTGADDPGGPLKSSSPGPVLAAYLVRDAGSYRWVAAGVGSTSQYQLVLGHPVLPIGGPFGHDRSPALAWFQASVARKEIHYFIADTMTGGPDAIAITSWVSGHFRPSDVDGVAIYDLTAPPTP